MKVNLFILALFYCFMLQFPECSGLQKGKGLIIPCLVDSFNNISNVNCRAYIKKMKKIIFSDYRLVYKFVDACQNDITQLKCGRTTLNNEEVSQLYK